MTTRRSELVTYLPLVAVSEGAAELLYSAQNQRSPSFYVACMTVHTVTSSTHRVHKTTHCQMHHTSWNTVRCTIYSGTLGTLPSSFAISLTSPADLFVPCEQIFSMLSITHHNDHYICLHGVLAGVQSVRSVCGAYHTLRVAYGHVPSQTQFHSLMRGR